MDRKVIAYLIQLIICVSFTATLPFKPSVKTDVNKSVSATILHSGEMAFTWLWRRARLQKATKGYKEHREILSLTNVNCRLTFTTHFAIIPI